jgi:hypothetical protein
LSVYENEATVGDLYLALDIINELASEEDDEGECIELGLREVEEINRDCVDTLGGISFLSCCDRFGKQKINMMDMQDMIFSFNDKKNVLSEFLGLIRDTGANCSSTMPIPMAQYNIYCLLYGAITSILPLSSPN